MVHKAPWELPGCDLMPAPLLGGQGETEERGRPLQIGRRQVSYGDLLNKACLVQMQDK